ncbi:MAG TPA: helix-turn-helix domain-containing protein [Candidatus Nanoarchaeia archaeon]|nr:helix-turn-helix domain-containing protein [Candidatus Nanoarchaeia archaeon]
MKSAEKVMRAAFETDEVFQAILSRVIKEELRMTAAEFSEKSGIPPSTLYKILSGHRDPNMKTVRQIVKTIKKIEGDEHGEFIAVIAARPVLDNIIEKKMLMDDKLITIREYSATSMEEAIVAAIKAERDGAKALVCAPIVSPTVEKVLTIPVTAIMPRDSLIEAIRLAAKKSR